LISQRSLIPPKIALSWSLGLSFSLFCFPCFALPPCEDLPEEILRSEIITEARSPLDGRVMTPSEYSALTEKLQTSSFSPQLNSNLRNLILLLQLRHYLKAISPLF